MDLCNSFTHKELERSSEWLSWSSLGSRKVIPTSFPFQCIFVNVNSNLTVLVIHTLTGLKSAKSGTYFKQTNIEFVPIFKTLKWNLKWMATYYNDVIMGAMASQITYLTIDYSTIYSGADQRKQLSSASLALCGEFTGDLWIPRTNG